jgi:hypothetical protein
MPVFDTPEPITVQIDMPAGDAWITASDRADTVVEVRPRHATSKADVTAAEQTTIEYAHGRLLIRSPRSWRRYSLFSSGPEIDILVQLPSGSHVRAEADWAPFRGEGRLGECHFKTGGMVRVAETAALAVDSAHGGVTADRVAGDLRVTTSSGTVRIGAVTGDAEIKNTSGECWVGSADGDVRVSTSSGDITVDHAHRAVNARTAHGSIRIGEVVRGAIDLTTSYGAIEVGVRAGTAAWLDLSSRHGRVSNTLSDAGGPEASDEMAEVRASTSYGPITVHRS